MSRTPPKAGVHWSPEEIEILTRLYPRAPWDDLLEALPGRTYAAIARQAHKRRIRRVGHHPRTTPRHRPSRPPGMHERNDHEVVCDPETGVALFAEIILPTRDGTERARTRVDMCDLRPLLEMGRWTLLTQTHCDQEYAYTKGGPGQPRTILMHRIVLGRVRGQALRSPRGDGEERMVVDHRDGDGLNNTRDNLALITQSQNLRKSKPYRRRASDQIGLPEGVRREFSRIVAIASIDRRGVSITRIDPADHESEDAAIALAACIRQAVQEMIHGPGAIGVDAEHRWRDMVSEDEAVRWAVKALETRGRYSLEMRERYKVRLRELRGMMVG